MLLLKNNSKFLLILFFIFSNFWIYKIFSESLFAGVISVVVSVLIFLRPQNIKIITFSMFILILIQLQTTHVKSLVNLDNDQQRVQQERIRSYPLTYIPIFSKVVWLKPEIWIEQNSIVIAASKIEGNFFDVLDINKYFFAGFPRNNNSDFQKFPFLFLPLFILGLFNMVSKKQYKLIFTLFLLPLILLSVIGNDNPGGQFILFPFFVISTTQGIERIFRKLNS